MAGTPRKASCECVGGMRLLALMLMLGLSCVWWVWYRASPPTTTPPNIRATSPTTTPSTHPPPTNHPSTHDLPSTTRYLSRMQSAEVMHQVPEHDDYHNMNNNNHSEGTLPGVGAKPRGDTAPDGGLDQAGLERLRRLALSMATLSGKESKVRPHPETRPRNETPKRDPETRPRRSPFSTFSRDPPPSNPPCSIIHLRWWIRPCAPTPFTTTTCHLATTHPPHHSSPTATRPQLTHRTHYSLPFTAACYCEERCDPGAGAPYAPSRPADAGVYICSPFHSTPRPSPHSVSPPLPTHTFTPSYIHARTRARTHTYAHARIRPHRFHARRLSTICQPKSSSALRSSGTVVWQPLATSRKSWTSKCARSAPRPLRTCPPRGILKTK